METSEQNEPGALYVSSVKEKGPVTRFGLGINPGRFNYIGASRESSDPKVVTFDEELIVKLPAREVNTYLREYTRALDSGALRRRTWAEYFVQQQTAEEQTKEDVKAEKAAADKAAKDKLDAESKAKTEAEATAKKEMADAVAAAAEKKKAKPAKS